MHPDDMRTWIYLTGVYVLLIIAMAYLINVMR